MRNINKFPAWAMLPIGRVLVLLPLLGLAACGGGSPEHSDAPTPAQEPSAFPSSPPDGPAPQIGPAPSDYRPTASGAPSTDIWLGRLTGQGAGLTIEELRNITDRDGYDNQPSFLPDGKALLYVSVLDAAQSDVFRYEIESGRSQRLTQTEASEFSPHSIPGEEAFSAIHELRGRQHLWRYSLQGEKLGAIFATAEPVGYHAWADRQTVAMFILGDATSEATLQVGNAYSGELHTVAQNPGRSIHRIPGTDRISFVRKLSPQDWWIERLDPSSGESERLVRTLPGQEDYAWTPRGEILIGDNSSLKSWSSGGEWIELQDLASHGLSGISRLAVSPAGDWIALVANREP